MIPLSFATGNHYGVCGLGKTGSAVMEALLAANAIVYAWDDNEKTNAAAKKKFPSITFAPLADWPWKKLNAVVMSPGIPLHHPKPHAAVTLAQKHKVELIGDVELLFRAQPRAKYIGITGTNGKSTTTALIGHMLKTCGRTVEVGGNIGTAALSLEPLEENGIYVLELSSYQLELVRTLVLDVAVLLNITPDHLDHHGTMENYIAAKHHIFDRQKKKNVAIVGIDDAVCDGICRALLKGRKQSVIPVTTTRTLGSGVFVKEGILHNHFALVDVMGDIRNVPALRGEHNWQNAAAAYAACYAMGMKHEEMIAAMQTYPGLPHRMQWLGEVKGIQFINDSKATNADAAEKSLRTYDYIYWILGGQAKEGGIESLARYFPRVRHAYLIGEAATAFEKTLAGKTETSPCGTLEKAFAKAVADATKDRVKGAAILLAPACASFDQFANFEARGDAFVALFDAYKKDQA